MYKFQFKFLVACVASFVVFKELGSRSSFVGFRRRFCDAVEVVLLGVLFGTVR